MMAAKDYQVLRKRLATENLIHVCKHLLDAYCLLRKRVYPPDSESIPSEADARKACDLKRIARVSIKRMEGLT